MNQPRQRLASLAIALVMHALCLWVLIPPFRPSETSPGPLATRTPAAAAPRPIPSSSPPETVRRDEADAQVPSPPSLRVYGFEFDLRKIRSRWRDLFPFVTTSLSLSSVARVQQRGEGGLMFADPAIVPRPLPLAPPLLSMSDSAIQRLADKTWSRHDRWTHFADYVKLATAYHPDRGSLASALRAYIQQNALQPYTDTSFPDPRRWAMLALAADHQDFIEFALPYVREHPSTRTATELLFLLDQLAQGSRDAFVLLLETPPRQLVWTHEENRDAYLLFDTLHEYYTDIARERGLTSIDAVNRKYVDVRLQLLSTLVRLTPNHYRTSDALFLIGTIHWRRGNTAEAIQAWRQMSFDANDQYVASYSQILEALAHDPADTTRINAILADEHRRWVDFSFDRLARFGYGFDRF
jgi:hypothetical protein